VIFTAAENIFRFKFKAILILGTSFAYPPLESINYRNDFCSRKLTSGLQQLQARVCEIVGTLHFAFFD
jgi:hypothetical protein